MNAASSSRPSSTRSLPARTTLGVAAVRDEREAARRRAGSSAGATASPSRPRARAARGSARRSAPSSTCGYSTRWTTSSSLPAGSLHPPIASSAVDDRAAGARRRPARRRPRAASRRTRSAGAISTCAGCVKRWPYESRPDGTPSTSTSTRLAVELRAEPADRPREAQPAARPAHRLREREPAHDRGEPLRQRPRRARRPRTRRPDEAVAPLELVGRDAVAAREALGRLRRRASSSKAMRSAGPGALLVGRALGQVVDDEREPPRPDVERRPARRRAWLRHELRQLRARLAAGRRRAAPRSRSQAAASAASSPADCCLDVELRDARARGRARARCTPRAR